MKKFLCILLSAILLLWLTIPAFAADSKYETLTGILSRHIRPPDNFTVDNKVTAEECIEMLKSLGIAVQTKSNIHQKFTILDAKTIWYGSVNFLSYGNAEESLMRFDSYDIAGELLDTVFVEKAEKM